MKLIAIVDNNWAIGYNGKLIENIKEDKKFFKEITTGNIIIVGRKTLETFPNKLPLPSRKNIILTRNENYSVKDSIITKSIEETLEKIRDYPDKEIFVVGGESIYNQFLKYCNMAYITKVNNKYISNEYLENLDINNNWECIFESEKFKSNDVEYCFLKYKRKNVEKK